MGFVFEFCADFGSVAALLLLSALIGLGILWFVRPIGFRYPALIAPILGFGVICISATILYRIGLSPSVVFWGVVIAALAVAALGYRVSGGIGALWTSRPSLPFGLLLLGVIVLALIPANLGGDNFRTFQGNPHDELTYLSMGVYYHKTPYVTLKSLSGEAVMRSNFIGRAGFMLGRRPAVQIGYSVLSNIVYGGIVQKAYLYQVFLQTLIFFGIAFLVLNVVGLSLVSSAVVGATGAVGFYAQYAVDISAWSQLAFLSIMPALAASVLIAVCIEPPPGQFWRPSAKMAAIVGALLALMFYLYPEGVPSFTAVMLLTVAVLLLIRRDRTQAVWALWTLGFALALGLAMVLLDWEGSLRILPLQLKFAASGITNTWHNYTQGYIFYASKLEPDYNGLYAIFSWPVDFFYGAAGLYLLRPHPEWPLFVRIAWKLMLYVPMALIICGLVIAGWRSFHERKLCRYFGLWLMAMACIGGVALVALLGQYWSAGKTLAFLSSLPFVLFATLFAPNLRLPAIIAVSAMLYLFGYGAFGLARPIAAATSTSGLVYAPPYPVATWKVLTDWDIGPALKSTAACQHVNVDIPNIFLDTLVQLALDEQGRSWSSLQPINFYFDLAPDAGMQKVTAGDCLLTTVFDPTQGRDRLIAAAGSQITSKSPALPQKPQSLEVTLSKDKRATTSGLSGWRLHDGRPLRWTDGQAQITVPASQVGFAPAKLTVALLGRLEPGTDYRLSINGRELLSGRVYRKTVIESVDIPPEFRSEDLVIQLESQAVGSHQKIGVGVGFVLLTG
jgi:hypothetical protein